ncbi:hypothetical protein [Yoonia tamlensis]|uniref:hypothetical protein n=1 Tax=Yoonia tamlensis TaxID=390270 RepID=UPI000B7F21C4|nr:hypothetical protein [Yoonia tamlensis]
MDHIDYYGVEAAYSAGEISAQGYLGHGDTGTQEITIFGASGAYGFGNGIAAIGEMDFLDIADCGETYNTIELGGSYETVAGASVYATLGNLGSDDGTGFDEIYYSIGATFSFGPDGGITFAQPTYLELPLPF